MENDGKDKNLKNSALYCYVCLDTTEHLENRGILCIRTQDPHSGKTVTICNECLKALNRKLYTDSKPLSISRKLKKIKENDNVIINQITPRYIYNVLNKYVMGQDKAKKAISLAVATHLQRIDDSSIEKSNILLIGPTGTGKTELARTVSKILSLPLAIVDATTFTAHGYVGEDVESILFNLLQSADGNVSLAERGIVFIDEFDKLASTNDQSFVNTSSVQQSLLKMIEGGLVKIPKSGNKKDSGDSVTIDTSKILFICSGAFQGLEELIEKDSSKRSIGLNMNSSNKIKFISDNPFINVTTKHLIKFGIIPELLGRLPVITSTEQLNESTLISILTEPKDSLVNQYKKILSAYGVTIDFTTGFLKSVAKEALSSGIGARGLRSVMEKRLEDALFDGPDMIGDKYILARANKIEFNPSKSISEIISTSVTESSPESEINNLIEHRRSLNKKGKNKDKDNDEQES